MCAQVLTCACFYDFLTRNLTRRVSMHLTNDSKTMSLQQAINKIYFYKGVVPFEAYEMLINHQQEATPYLLQILKKAVLNHDRTGDYYVAHIHAILLLSQFREKQAYPIVIELLNLPIDSIDRLLGDMLTETIPKIVASIYDGNPEPLFALLINPKTEDVVRWVIGSCLTTLIYQKLLDKDRVILTLQEIIASGKMNQDIEFFSTLADLTIDCKLEPLYDSIRAAFKAGMIRGDKMDIHCFEKHLKEPIKQLPREENLNLIADAAKELSEWGNYSDEISHTVKIERNAPCPCGSGHKFKKCCIHRL